MGDWKPIVEAALDKLLVLAAAGDESALDAVAELDLADIEIICQWAWKARQAAVLEKGSTDGWR